MPVQRGPDISPFTIALVIIILLIFLKLSRILPGSPQEEVFNLVSIFMATGLVIVGSFAEWLRRRFRDIDGRTEQLRLTLEHVTQTLDAIRLELQHLREYTAFQERLVKLEEKVGKA